VEANGIPVSESQVPFAKHSVCDRQLFASELVESRTAHLCSGENSLVSASGKRYSICLLDPKGRTKKIEVKCYGNILGSYREHPEAKFLGSDGEACNKLTRGLLRRSHIVVNQHRHIGKETSRKWEQRDDTSLVDFHCTEYSDGKRWPMKN
jgi:hypothetical protein